MNVFSTIHACLIQFDVSLVTVLHNIPFPCTNKLWFTDTIIRCPCAIQLFLLFCIAARHLQGTQFLELANHAIHILDLDTALAWRRLRYLECLEPNLRIQTIVL